MGTHRAALMSAVLAAAVAACSPSSGPATTAGSAATPSPTTRAAVATPAASRNNGYIQPGDPIPAELTGLWRDTIGDWVWFLAPGDPYCAKVIHTTQSCHIFWNDATVQGKPVPWYDLVTVVDGKLRFYSLGGQTCEAQVSTVAYKVAADGVDLTLQPGSCFTDVFDLIRPGSNGQPSASVAPTLPVPAN